MELFTDAKVINLQIIVLATLQNSFYTLLGDRIISDI